MEQHDIRGTSEHAWSGSTPTGRASPPAVGPLWLLDVTATSDGLKIAPPRRPSPVALARRACRRRARRRRLGPTDLSCGHRAGHQGPSGVGAAGWAPLVESAPATRLVLVSVTPAAPRPTPRAGTHRGRRCWRRHFDSPRTLGSSFSSLGAGRRVRGRRTLRQVHGKPRRCPRARFIPSPKEAATLAPNVNSTPRDARRCAEGPWARHETPGGTT